MNFLKMALAIVGGYVIATVVFFMLGIIFGLIGLGAFIATFTESALSVGIFWLIAILCTVKIRGRL